MLIRASKEVVLKLETERAASIVLPRCRDSGNADCASDDARGADFEMMRGHRIRNERSGVQWAASSMCSPACSTSCPMPWTVLQLLPKRAARVAIRIRINCFREAFIILRRRVVTLFTMLPPMTPRHGVKPYRDPQADHRLWACLIVTESGVSIVRPSANQSGHIAPCKIGGQQESSCRSRSFSKH